MAELVEHRDGTYDIAFVAEARADIAAHPGLRLVALSRSFTVNYLQGQGQR